MGEMKAEGKRASICTQPKPKTEPARQYQPSGRTWVCAVEGAFRFRTVIPRCAWVLDASDAVLPCRALDFGVPVIGIGVLRP